MTTEPTILKSYQTSRSMALAGVQKPRRFRTCCSGAMESRCRHGRDQHLQLSVAHVGKLGVQSCQSRGTSTVGTTTARRRTSTTPFDLDRSHNPQSETAAHQESTKHKQHQTPEPEAFPNAQTSTSHKTLLSTPLVSLDMWRKKWTQPPTNVSKSV
jgi:hypothetical protein